MRRAGLLWGAVLVVVGLVLLAANVGLITVGAWNVIWPALLILLGIWIVIGGTARRRAAVSVPVSVPLGGAARGRVVLRHGAGRLSIGAGAQPGTLVSGTFVGGVDHRESVMGDELTTDLSVPRDAGWAWGPGWGHGLDWDVRLADAVPLTLDVQAGANEAGLDLSALHVSDLRIQTGASSVAVTLPAAAGYTRVSVKTGAASVRIAVPPDVAAHVTSSGALASVNVDERRFPRAPAGWESPNFAEASNRADIAIEVGVGSVQVV